VEKVVDFPVWRISTVVLSVWPELTSLLASQNKNTIGSATLQSWRFKAEFVERGNLLPELVAASTLHQNKNKSVVLKNAMINKQD